MGCGREDDFIFVVTEYAEKGTLSDLLWSSKKGVSIQTRLDLLLCMNWRLVTVCMKFNVM